MLSGLRAEDLHAGTSQSGHLLLWLEQLLSSLHLSTHWGIYH